MRRISQKTELSSVIRIIDDPHNLLLRTFDNSVLIVTNIKNVTTIFCCQYFNAVIQSGFIYNNY
jgi:hypothetical protein